MAITQSAKKAARVATRRGVFNARRAKALKDNLKDMRRFATAKSAKEAEKLIPALQKAVDKAVKRGIIKANAAARIKSRIAKKIRALTQ